MTEQTTTVKFYPVNDQVLIRMDTKRKSILERGVNDQPTILPSGVVVAVGRGVFVPGTGFVAPQVQAGDHVMLDIGGGRATALPLSENKDEIYMTFSETDILGKLEGATPDSPWFAALDRAEALTNAALRRAKR